jgi:hypothetical protein
MRAEVTVPTSAGVGDWDLLVVRSEGATVDITVDDSNVSALTGTEGTTDNWQRIFQRPYTGDEPSVWHIDGVGIYVQGVALVVSDADPTTPFVVGAIENTTGNKDDAPTHTISAVTTTVDNSLVVIGYTSYAPFLDGDAATLDPPDPTLFASADLSTPLRIWTLAAPTAGTVGPWTVDRSVEVQNFTTAGVVSWTVVLQPPSAGPTPTIADDLIEVGFSYEAAPPALRRLPGPHGEFAVIGGATQAEQDALVAAQLAAWGAESPFSDFLDHYDTDFAAADAAIQRLMAAVRGLIPS